MTSSRLITAAQGVVGDELPVLVDRPWYRVDFEGNIVETGSGEPQARAGETVRDLGRALVLPGFVNAHSHAFQRGIRGGTGRRGGSDPNDFWSWREAMYGAALGHDPDSFHAVTRDCFAEMLRAGITCVGEFHYIHHQPDGTPYADPNELSHRVIAAAREVGIRLCLLEVFYERAGHDSPALPEQRRFCDASVDAYLERIDALRTRYADEGVRLGITPHSVRAVTEESLRRLAAYASEHDLVIHAHVSEQTRENEECLAEHAKTPTQLLADTGCLDTPRRFTAVHAVHVDETDVALLGPQHVCACPTTEADLGDGIVPASRLARAGSVLALGSDSNSIIDLVQEARLLEMHERLRTGARLCLRDEAGAVAPTLLGAATTAGASSLGRPELGALATGRPFDAVAIDCTHVTLRDVADAHRLDALFLAGTSAPVAAVWVGGQRRL